MEHLLFAAYLVLFAWLITRIKFFRESGLTRAQLVILFLLKVMAGIFYGWIGIYYGEMAQMIDTWAYHMESLREYQLLQHHPVEFFTNLFHTDYEGGYGNFLTTHNSWWNDVKANFLIKIMALFHVFSFGHYYVNVIFYCFLTMFGPVAVYRVMRDVFPTRKMAVLFATFLIPSFLYWTSGLHKEGLLCVGLSLMLYHFYFGFKEGRFPFYRVALIFLGFGLILILRNFVILILLPPLFAWVLAQRLPLRPLQVFGGVCLLFILFFFTAKYIHPKLDFPAYTVLKQHEFLSLGGGSAVTVEKLEPNFPSFVVNFPQAMSLSIVRPYPSDVKHLLSLAAAVEINLLLLFFLIFLFWRRRGTSLSPVLLFCLFFSFAFLMMIGYTVNILGAIVRYRSIALPLLCVPMFAQIDWDRINQLFFEDFKKNNNI